MGSGVGSTLHGENPYSKKVRYKGEDASFKLAQTNSKKHQETAASFHVSLVGHQ